MCDAPIYIKNPNRGLGVNGLKFKGIKTPVKFNNNHNVLKDCTSSYIKVPCGICHACIVLKQSYIVQRCQLLSFSYQFFFCTFTYNHLLPVMEVNGRKIKYADVRHIQDFIRRIKLQGIIPHNVKYLAVSERGGEKHRPHWHLLIAIPNSYFKSLSPAYLDYFGRSLLMPFLDNWVVNKGTRKHPIYHKLCTYHTKRQKRNFDVQWVNPYYSNNGSSDVAFYVSKYIMKVDDYTNRLRSALKLNLEESEFNEIWKKLKNHTLMSKHFGECDDSKSLDYVRKGIDYSKRNGLPYPVFINPNTGQTFPLSPYLKSKYFTLDDAYYYYYRDKSDRLDSIHDTESVDVAKFDRLKYKFDKQKDLLSRKNELNFFDDE